MAKRTRHCTPADWPADPLRIESDLRQCIIAIRDQNPGAAVPADAWRRLTPWFDGEFDRRLRGRLVDGEGAEDLRQEVLVRILTGKFSTFDGAKRATPFVRASCHRMAATKFVTAKRRKTGPLGDFVPTDAGPLPEEELAGSESFAAVEKHVDALAEPQRTFVRLRFRERLTLADIGDRCGCAASTVHAHLEKAIVLLRELLQDEGYSH
jgi:RNA polymerase sigma factor (sigma-70 family)